MRLSELYNDTLLERIVRKGKGWGVVSKKGKNLGSKTKSGKPMTKAQAHRRLGQVEYFKHKG
jgi:hypothetical protein